MRHRGAGTSNQGNLEHGCRTHVSPCLYRKFRRALQLNSNYLLAWIRNLSASALLGGWSHCAYTVRAPVTLDRCIEPIAHVSDIALECRIGEPDRFASRANDTDLPCLSIWAIL